MVAPKGPGTALRSLYLEGKGMPALYAVAQDASGGAEAIALAYGRAIGCGRAGLIATSFAEECDADLFNEAAVVWGAVPEILIAGFDTLVEGGISEEVAYHGMRRRTETARRTDRGARHRGRCAKRSAIPPSLAR